MARPKQPMTCGHDASLYYAVGKCKPCYYKDKKAEPKYVEMDKAYRERVRDSVNEQRRLNRNDEIREYEKRYQAENRERLRPARIAAQRRYREKNRELIIAK